MIIIGLTGSIGMGKSTTAQMFRDAGIPVHDADAVVHALYEGEAALAIEDAFPNTLVDGAVDRKKLAPMVVGKPEAMKRLEAIVHPLVAAQRDKFLKENEASGAKLVIMDIPLLFETGGDKMVDKIIVVTAPADVQRTRVLAREGMSIEKFEAILAKQIPDEVKRKKADFIIDTSLGMEAAKEEVQRIITSLA